MRGSACFFSSHESKRVRHRNDGGGDVCRYDVALDTNTIGPFRLMSFARRCEKLKLFLHVSTGTDMEAVSFFLPHFVLLCYLSDILALLL